MNPIPEKADRFNSVLAWRQVSGLGRSSHAHFSLSFKSSNKHTHTKVKANPLTIFSIYVFQYLLGGLHTEEMQAHCSQEQSHIGQDPTFSVDKHRYLKKIIKIIVTSISLKFQLAVFGSK